MTAAVCINTTLSSVEIVSTYSPTLEAAKTSCDTFHNPLSVSQVSDHIIVVGSLVEHRGHHS